MEASNRSHRTRRGIVRALLDAHGRTFADEAGITLRDKPAPLYQLMVLTLLSSARIGADIAVDSARELFASGWRTPQRMRESTWQQRVDALGRGGYRRYDESTATKLEESAHVLLDDYAGDLRRLRPDGGAAKAAEQLRDAIAAFPRIGPTGAGIFVREVQDLWSLAPYFDERALRAAADLDLPTQAGRLAALAPQGQVARLASALVKAG